MTILIVVRGLHVPSISYTAIGNGSPTDSNITYVGRWDVSSSAVAISYWSGAYFKVGFTGTTVKIKLAAKVNIWVSIDSGADIYYSHANGTVNLTQTPLAAGNHILRVAAPTSADSTKFQGLVLDTDATTSPLPPASNLIEFIGDSIT